MLKIVLIVVLLLALSGGVFFLVFMRSNTQSPKEVPKTLSVTSPFSNDEEESSSASELAAQLSKPLPSNADSNTKISLLENKIKALETSNIQLATRISKLESIDSATTLTTPASTTSNSKAPQYIYPLGYGSSTTKTDWTEITTLSVVIDPALYSGYSSMQLEGFIRVRDGNGRAYARLYSNGLAIVPSEISTTSWQNTWISSNTFTVSSKKTYTFQVKSLTGYEAFIEDARIKINY